MIRYADYSKFGKDFNLNIDQFMKDHRKICGYDKFALKFDPGHVLCPFKNTFINSIWMCVDKKYIRNYSMYFIKIPTFSIPDFELIIIPGWK